MKKRTTKAHAGRKQCFPFVFCGLLEIASIVACALSTSCYNKLVTRLQAVVHTFRKLAFNVSFCFYTQKAKGIEVRAECFMRQEGKRNACEAMGIVRPSIWSLIPRPKSSSADFAH